MKKRYIQAHAQHAFSYITIIININDVIIIMHVWDLHFGTTQRTYWKRIIDCRCCVGAYCTRAQCRLRRNILRAQRAFRRKCVRHISAWGRWFCRSIRQPASILRIQWTNWMIIKVIVFSVELLLLRYRFACINAFACPWGSAFARNMRVEFAILLSDFRLAMLMWWLLGGSYRLGVCMWLRFNSRSSHAISLHLVGVRLHRQRPHQIYVDISCGTKALAYAIWSVSDAYSSCMHWAIFE